MVTYTAVDVSGGIIICIHRMIGWNKNQKRCRRSFVYVFSHDAFSRYWTLDSELCRIQTFLQNRICINDRSILVINRSNQWWASLVDVFLEIPYYLLLQYSVLYIGFLTMKTAGITYCGSGLILIYLDIENSKITNRK